MIFNPENLTLKRGVFAFKSDISAKANKCVGTETIKDFWFGFTFRTSKLEITLTNDLIFKIGEAEALPLDGNLYSINVTETGIFIKSETENGLINAYMTLIDRITINEDNILSIPCCEIKETPLIYRRMVHYCIFPDTEIYELERFVRLSGALKYSHIILEFWGMLKYDCLKELSWEHGFKKEEIKPIIKMANELGMEVIPMFNHWGHASASRVIHGKHVVLDQKPHLQYLFSEDGWCWNINSEKVKSLLKEIRNELIALCGDGEYFHVGCDEAYGFEKDKSEEICAFINEINDDLNSIGRRTIMWGDMLITKDENFNHNNKYLVSAPDKECQLYFLNNICKNIVIADWQYWAKVAPLETSMLFKKSDFEVLTCPWDIGCDESDACIETVKKSRLLGIMHTTWHTLSSGTPHVIRNAVACWETDYSKTGYDVYRTKSSAILRKVYYVDGDYNKAGWSKYEIPIKC